jgi:hypothetical protein
MSTTGRRMAGALPPAGPLRVSVLDHLVSRSDERSPWSAQGLTAARQSLVAAGPSGLPALELTSGLPEAEAVDGSDVTIAHLMRIDPTALSRSDRWRHASALARQSALQGRLADSIEWADTAQQLARSRDEKVTSALATRSVRSAVTDPAARLAVLDTVADDVDDASPELRAEYLLLRAIDLFESADTSAALECHNRLCSVTPLPALRRWHAPRPGCRQMHLLQTCCTPRVD